jgi:glycosyltransferase involved in cell wall biosynthesis
VTAWKPPLHVAIDARILDRPGMEKSGLGRYALEITRALWHARPEWEFTVYSNRADLFESPPRGRRRATRWPTQVSAGRVAWIHVGSAPVALRKRPDVWFGPTYVLPVWWAGPAVVTIQDLVFLLLRERYVGKVNAMYATAATRLSARRAARVICPSGDTRDALIAKWGVAAHKIDLVPNGISEIFFETPGAGGSRQGRVEAPPFLLYVGVFEPRKGLDVIADALSELNSGDIKAELVLAGRPGWGAHDAVDILRRRTEVRIVESPSDEVLASLYRNALALVYPSRMEGFGLPVAEAMASGCPVIATGLGPIREFAGDVPLYVRPDDARQLVQHVETLLHESDRDRQARRQAGREAVTRLRWLGVADSVAASIAGATKGDRP